MTHENIFIIIHEYVLLFINMYYYSWICIM